MTANNTIKYRGYEIKRGTDNVGSRGQEVKPYTTFNVSGCKFLEDPTKEAPLYCKAIGNTSIKQALQAVKDGIDWYISQGWIALEVCLGGENFGEVQVIESLVNGHELCESEELQVKVLKGITGYAVGEEITIAKGEF